MADSKKKAIKGGTKTPTPRKRKAKEPDLNDFYTPMQPLSPTALRYWNFLIRELEGQGIVTLVDKPLLTVLCRWFGVHDDAMAVIEKLGSTYSYTNKAGAENETLRPESQIAKSALEFVLKLSKEFGLTARSRARLAAMMTESYEGATEDDEAVFGDV